MGLFASIPTVLSHVALMITATVDPEDPWKPHMRGRSKSDPNEQRRCGRLRFEWARCEFGEILDMSGSGMRVRSTRSFQLRPGDVGTIVVKAPKMEPMRVPVEVVWTKKLRFRRHEMGVKFLMLDEQSKERLSEFMRICSVRRVMAA